MASEQTASPLCSLWTIRGGGGGGGGSFINDVMLLGGGVL